MAALLHVVVIEEFSNGGVVEVLNAFEMTDVVVGDKVDGISLAAETTTSTDSKFNKQKVLANWLLSGRALSQLSEYTPVNVVLVIDGQVEVDDERNLLHVNASSQKISGD